MTRIVLDTNTIVSALLWGGLPWMVYKLVLSGDCIALTTEALLGELESVIRRPKFSAALAKFGRTADEILTLHRRVAEIVTPAEIPADAVRDPKDRVVLACALGGKADFIVSGDKDLLVLEQYEAIPIMSASQFLDTMK